MADIQVSNTDADLSNNTLLTEENAYTITGLHTFSRSTNAPFAVNSGAAVVANLDADKLDGQEGSYYLAAGNATGTLAVGNGGTGTTSLTDGGVLLGSGTSAVTAMAVLSDGEMIVGDGSTDPVAESGATLRTSIGVGTGDSPQFTAIELGAASDTTIARASAGNVTIEGNAIYRAGGTDVAVADGGTGASSLTDGGVLLGSGTSAVTAMAVLSDGEMIVGDGSTDPVAESGATLRTSIGVGTGDSPQFTGLSISGTGASALDVGGGINAGTGNVSLVGTDGKLEGPLSSTIIDDLSGANLTTLNASNLSSGTVATARLGSGTASSSTFLRGDSSWAAPASDDPALGVAEGRLTATSNTPVTTADVSGATSIYYTPYVGDKIALYDGSSWNIRTFTQITISLSGFTAIKPYDVFAYDNSGTVTIETLIWTNNTTRATALAYQNGVLSKSGATTRRYLGTVYINASGGQTEDTMVKRYLWNYYNRVRRPLQRLETTDSWTYTTATYRQANASTSNQVDTCVGWPEALLNLNVLGLAANTIGDNNCTVQVGIDEGGTSANDATAYSAPEIATYNAKQVEANLTKYPSVGFQYWVWTEKSTATGTTTWYGDGAGICKSGLYGEIDG